MAMPQRDNMIEAIKRRATEKKAAEEKKKAAARARGGKWVVLSPEGFYDRWHPPRDKERFCAEGRMIFLSLYPPMDRLPTKQELYRRCHRWAISPSQGWSNAGQQGTPHKILAPGALIKRLALPQGAR